MSEPVFNQDLFESMLEIDSGEAKSREEYIRAPFGWPGGKWHSIEYLNKYLPIRAVYNETCGGSGIVLLNRRKSKLEIFNDRHSGVVAFFRCIKDEAKCRQLINKLRLIVHSREEFLWCKETWQDRAHDDVERAARWYYMIRFSFSQIGRNFARATSGVSIQAKAVARSLNHFHGIHARFAEVQVENLDINQCLKDFDSSGTVHYIDPDYIGTDQGLYAGCRVDHRLMLQEIEHCRGFVALSGYANRLYDSKTFWDDRLSWEVVVTSKAQVGDPDNQDRGIKAEEVLWIKEAK